MYSHLQSDNKSSQKQMLKCIALWDTASVVSFVVFSTFLAATGYQRLMFPTNELSNCTTN